MEDATILRATESNKAERRQSRRHKRFTRRRGACEVCKQRKVRCDGGKPCNQCQKSSCNCRYTLTNRSSRSISVYSLESAISQNSPSREHNSVQITREHASLSLLPNGQESPTWLNISPISSSGPVINLTVGDISAVPYGSDSSTKSTCNDPFTESDEFHLSDTIDFTDMTMLTNFWTPDECNNQSARSQNEIMSQAYPWEQHDKNSEGNINYSSMLTNPALNIHVENMVTIVPEASFPVDLTVSPLFVGLNSEYLKANSLQQREISQALRVLIAARFNTSVYHDLKNKNKHDHSLTYRRQFAQQCIKACYSDSQGIGLFLDQKPLEDIFREQEEQVDKDLACLALVNAVLAVGSHFVNFQGERNTQETIFHDAPEFFDKALKLRNQLLASQISIRNLQALLVMLHFSFRTGSKMTPELMMGATHYVQALRLNNHGAVYRAYQSPTDQADAKRALSFLYSIETHYCLRYRMYPLLNGDFVDHAQSEVLLSNEHPDWLSIQYRYSTLCSDIIRDLYGHNAFRRQQFEKLERSLSAWKDELPFTRDSSSKISHNYLALDSPQRRLQLSTLFKYHEAVITMVMGRTEADSVPFSTSDIHQSHSNEICLSSAREVLTLSCHISIADVQDDWGLYYLVCVATYVIFVFIIKNPKSQKDLSYFGMASGFFGRLSLNAEVPFEEVMELSKIAREIVKKYSQDVVSATNSA